MCTELNKVKSDGAVRSGILTHRYRRNERERKRQAGRKVRERQKETDREGEGERGQILNERQSK